MIKGLTVLVHLLMVPGRGVFRCSDSKVGSYFETCYLQLEDFYWVCKFLQQLFCGCKMLLAKAFLECRNYIIIQNFTYIHVSFLGKCRVHVNEKELPIYCAFQQDADSKTQSSTDKCVFCYCQSNVWWLLPASDYCQVRHNQIIGHSSDHKTVLGNSWKLGGAALHLISGS